VIHSDENKKYMKMTKDDTLEGSSQQANKDLITRRNRLLECMTLNEGGGLNCLKGVFENFLS